MPKPKAGMWKRASYIRNRKASLSLASTALLYVVVHDLLIDADYCGSLAVGDTLLLKEK